MNGMLSRRGSKAGQARPLTVSRRGETDARRDSEPHAYATDVMTETFVAAKLLVENWRWAGVPFYIRTGKQLPAKATEVAIQFKAVPHSIFATRGAASIPNRLIIASPSYAPMSHPAPHPCRSK